MRIPGNSTLRKYFQEVTPAQRVIYFLKEGEECLLVVINASNICVNIGKLENLSLVSRKGL